MVSGFLQFTVSAARAIGAVSLGVDTNKKKRAPAGGGREKSKYNWRRFLQQLLSHFKKTKRLAIS